LERRNDATGTIRGDNRSNSIARGNQRSS
jgi:hypothetical protein